MGASSTITIDLSTKRATYSSPVMAIRETVAVAIVNTGVAVAANLKMYVLYRSDVIIQVDAFVTGSGQFDGTLDLDDDTLIAFFTGLNDGQAKKTFDLTLWDFSRNKLLINDKITIMNNPYDPDMPLPTVI